jgi:hypothetical protein
VDFVDCVKYLAEEKKIWPGELTVSRCLEAGSKPEIIVVKTPTGPLIMKEGKSPRGLVKELTSKGWQSVSKPARVIETWPNLIPLDGCDPTECWEPTEQCSSEEEIQQMILQGAFGSMEHLELEKLGRPLSSQELDEFTSQRLQDAMDLGFGGAVTNNSPW